MTQPPEIQPRASKNLQGTFDCTNFEDEGHEYLIGLYFDDEKQASGMADRFPSLNDFDAGNLLRCH